MSNEAPSKILPPPVPSAAQHGAPVVLHGVTHKPLEAEAVGFDDGKLVLLAKGDVRSNVLGKLDMSATESVHVRVVSCVADAGHFVVKVSPFALSVKQHAAWKAFGSSLEAQRAA
jgi:hypothetical protein